MKVHQEVNSGGIFSSGYFIKNFVTPPEPSKRLTGRKNIISDILKLCSLPRYTCLYLSRLESVLTTKYPILHSNTYYTLPILVINQPLPFTLTATSTVQSLYSLPHTTHLPST